MSYGSTYTGPPTTCVHTQRTVSNIIVLFITKLLKLKFQVPTPVSTGNSSTTAAPGQDVYGTNPSNPQAPPTSYPSSQYPTATTTDLPQYNPYVSANQYQSSFMSGEGAQSIQSLMGTQVSTYSQVSTQQYTAYTHPPPPATGAPPPAVNTQYSMPGAPQQFPPGYNPTQYPASAAAPGPVGTTRPPFQQQTVQQAQPYQAQSYSQYPQYSNYQQQNQQPGYDQYRGGGAGSGNYTGGGGGHGGHRQRGSNSSHRGQQSRGNSNITTVRITGR